MAARVGAAAAGALAAAATAGAGESVPSVTLPRPTGPESLAEEARWLGDVMCFYLDDEWTPLPVHRRLGDALAEAYVAAREAGTDEVGSLILGLSESLVSFNFREAFVNRFEVANKAGEVLMMRAGMDVCCTSPDDDTLLLRFEAWVQAQVMAQDPEAAGGNTP